MIKPFLTLVISSCIIVSYLPGKIINYSEDEKQDQFEIPFILDRNLIIIQGKLNNQEVYNFIFDTGTTGIVISDSITYKYKLKTKGYTTLRSPNGQVMEKAKNVIIPSVSLNGFSMKHRKAISVKPENIFPPNVIGIIGLSAFNGNLLTIDYQNSRLIVKKGKLSPNENVIKINTANILEAKIVLNDNEVLAHFDCGSPNYIAIPMEWDTQYKLKSEPVLLGKGRTPGGEFEIYKAQFYGNIIIGSIVLKDPQIELVTGGFPAVNLGFRFFKTYLITIDTKNELMQIIENK